jgi:hypothetical protein
MTQVLAKNGFETDKLSAAEKYQAKLKDKRFFYRGLIHEIEVIPFEKMWELIIQKVGQ